MNNNLKTTSLMKKVLKTACQDISSENCLGRSSHLPAFCTPLLILLMFKSLKICQAVQKLGTNFGNSLAISQQLLQQLLQQLGHQVAAQCAHNLILIISFFESLKICPAVQNIGRSFCSNFAIEQQLSQQLWQQLGLQLAAQ